MINLVSSAGGGGTATPQPPTRQDKGNENLVVASARFAVVGDGTRKRHASTSQPTGLRQGVGETGVFKRRRAAESARQPQVVNGSGQERVAVVSPTRLAAPV